MPEIEIRFEQLQTMKKELEDLFCEININNDSINGNPLMFIKGAVKLEIQYALEYLFEESLIKNISRLIVEIHYSRSKEHEHTAAYFDYLKSSKSINHEFYFGIYFSEIKK